MQGRTVVRDRAADQHGGQRRPDFVMEKGQIVARGTHEELLESSEIYAEIYSSQLMTDEDSRRTRTDGGKGQELLCSWVEETNATQRSEQTPEPWRNPGAILGVFLV